MVFEFHTNVKTDVNTVFWPHTTNGKLQQRQYVVVDKGDKGGGVGQEQHLWGGGGGVGECCCS